MPQSPGFKTCASCSKSVPLSNPHSSCLKCLVEAHRKDCCQICKDFRHWKPEGTSCSIEGPPHGGSPKTDLGAALGLSTEYLSFSAECTSIYLGLSAPVIFPCAQEETLQAPEEEQISDAEGQGRQGESKICTRPLFVPGASLSGACTHGSAASYDISSASNLWCCQFPKPLLRQGAF